MNNKYSPAVLEIIKLIHSDRLESAFHKISLAIKEDVKNADLIFEIGINLSESERIEDAVKIFECLKIIFKNEVQIPYNIGCLYAMMENYQAAYRNFQDALRISPDDIDILINCGSALHELQNFEEAIILFDKALRLQPTCAEALRNKGNTLALLKRYDEAVANFDRALILKPNLDWCAGDYVHAKTNICSWLDLADSIDHLSKRVISNQMAILPFVLLSLSDSISLHQKAAEIFSINRFPSNSTLGAINYVEKEKIRIGYYSADFGNHPVSMLIAELFELHDKNKFEIIAFSYGRDDHSPMHLRLKHAFNHFYYVSDKSDIEIAKLSRQSHIDIAIDLGGHTTAGRAGIFAYRAAPIQVNYLGYPGTMGAEYIDYIIADKVLIPPQSQQYYSEKVVYLPNSYQANDRKRLISDRQFTRQELGLPQNGFVFCCFNNNYKILPATFAVWMRILKTVEGSVLWLFQDNSWAAGNLKIEAEKQGIAADRLVFAGRMALPEHLARHRLADLFLDTFPYNAHTTASDALWAGLPVLTLIGKSFASRVAASLLNAIGLPELITDTQEAYEALAVELAKNPQKLVDITLKLAKNRLTTPLFDTPLFTKNLETAYIKMYEQYQTDLESSHIYIV